MPTSSSNPATSASINPQLQLEPMFMSSEPENSRRHHVNTAPEPSNSHFISIQQNLYERVIFSQVLHYWWNNLIQNNHNIRNPTPPQLWFAQNVHPLVTPMRIFWFSMSLVIFLIAYGLFMQTDFYKSVTGHGGHTHLQLFFLAATGTGHTVWLICLLFFSFCSASHEKYKHHYLLKSIVEFMVMLLVLSDSGNRTQTSWGGWRCCYFCNKIILWWQTEIFWRCWIVDMWISHHWYALCVINLLEPGHHYSVFEATAALTLHLGLVGGSYLSKAAVCLFIFVILAIKNFLWRNVGRAEEASHEQPHLAWEVVWSTGRLHTHTHTHTKGVIDYLIPIHLYKKLFDTLVGYIYVYTQKG